MRCADLAAHVHQSGGDPGVARVDVRVGAQEATARTSGVSHRWDGVVARARLALLERQGVKPDDIGDVRGRHAVLATPPRHG